MIADILPAGVVAAESFGPPGDGRLFPAGAPRWPDGVVGSITHCAGYRACAVAPARGMAAIGIDAEPCLTLADGLLAAVAGAAERAWLAELGAASPGMPWDRLLFSAKESVYKAWYVYTGRRPVLQSVTIQISAAGTFAAGLPHDRGAAPGSGRPAAARAAAPPPARLTGRWLVGGGLIVTALTVPR